MTRRILSLRPHRTMAKDEPMVPHGEEAPTAGLSRQFGTVGGPLSAFAQRMDVAPAVVLRRLRALGITPMVDTGVDNPKDGSYDRPKDPQTRRLVLQDTDADALFASAQRFPKE